MKSTPNNLELLEFSLKKPEPLVDDFYVKSGGLIIPDSPRKLNKLMEANQLLLSNITAFRIAKDVKNKGMMEQIISTVYDLMKTKGINYSEFASFWSVIDVSHGAYNSLAEPEQKRFLKFAIEKYLEIRHGLYLRYGYTATTLQVGKDAKSHKRSGGLGVDKSLSILSDYGYQKLIELDIAHFAAQNKICICADGTGKKLFRDIVGKYQVEFLWSSQHERKMPDLLFKNGENLFIVEHKHIKESGGGQDKQLSEVISFISYSEPHAFTKVHYVTFMDGRYFNLFTKDSGGGSNKIKTQLAVIRQNLSNCPQNYFINTAGFRELLKRIN